MQANSDTTWLRNKRNRGKSPSLYKETAALTEAGAELFHSKSQKLVRSVSRQRVSLRGNSEQIGVSQEDIERLYTEKCKDMALPLIPDQLVRFHDFCLRHIRNRRFFLEENGLSANSVPVLSDLFSKPLNLAYIYLGSNPLGQFGVVTVLKSLKNSYTLVHLGLNSTDISPECAGEALPIMESQESVTSLDLSSQVLFRNRLGGVGGEGLKLVLRRNVVLSILNLFGTALGPEGAESLSLGIAHNTSLLWLNIGNNSLSGKIWENIGKAVNNSKIRYLNVSENKVNPIGAEWIGKMLAGVWSVCPLQSIDFSKCSLDPPCLRRLFPGLGKNASLKTINFEQNPFGSESVIEVFQCLVENNGIIDVSLSGCCLRGEGLETVTEGLAKNRSILSLNLSQNYFEDAGAAYISSFLCKNSTLKHIDLSSNYLKDPGGISLSKVFLSNRCLESMNLSDNSLDTGTGKALTEILRRNRTATKVGLDRTRVHMRFIREVNRLTGANKHKKQRSLTPILKVEIRSLKVKPEAFTQIDHEIAAKKTEESTQAVQFLSQKERFARVQVEEIARLASLQAESTAFQDEICTKSTELSRLQSTIDVFPTQEESKSYEIEVKMWENKFFSEAAEVTQREKECKSLKEMYGLKRLQATQQVNELLEIRDKEIKYKQLASYSLKNLREQIWTESGFGGGNTAIIALEQLQSSRKPKPKSRKKKSLSPGSKRRSKTPL